MSHFPEAEPACAEYAYADPKTAAYPLARLGDKYHPLDAWQTLGKEPPAFTRWLFSVGFGMALGVVAVVAGNHLYGRPKWAQIWQHFSIGTGLAALAHWNHVRVLETAQRRDAIIRMYLETHYDDFPLVQRRKVKDQLLPWTPSR